MTHAVTNHPRSLHRTGGFPEQNQPQPGLAGAYVHLASDEASYVSGAVVPVTGGKGL